MSHSRYTESRIRRCSMRKTTFAHPFQCLSSVAYLVLMFLAVPDLALADTGSLRFPFSATLVGVNERGDLSLSEIAPETHLDQKKVRVRGSFRLLGVSGVDAKSTTSVLSGKKVRCKLVLLNRPENFWAKLKRRFEPFLVECIANQVGDLSLFLINQRLASASCAHDPYYHPSCRGVRLRE